MHPAQHRRQRHEEARKTGTLDVHRHGRKIATLRKGAEQGTARVRPWVISMVDGTQVGGTYFAVYDAEQAAIHAAIRAEAKKTPPSDNKARFDAVATHAGTRGAAGWNLS